MTEKNHELPILVIKFASAADAGLIADLSRQTFYESFTASNTKENMDKFMAQQFTRNELIKEVGAPDNIFLLAYEDEQPVGYARMRENNNPPELGGQPAMEIARIYSIQSFIGRGVGKALMQKCIDTAKSHNYKLLWLGVWEHNQRALDFYTKWGFEKFSSHPFILGDDKQTDWLLKKKI